MPLRVRLEDVPRGHAVLRLEVFSAEGRLETQLLRAVQLACDSVSIRFTASAYRDGIFSSPKLDAFAGEVMLEENAAAWRKW